jgi:hypothetical protein
MKDDINARERADHSRAVAYVAFDELGLRVDPCGSAFAVRVRLKVIEYAHAVAFTQQEIDEVRADESRAARHERALPFVCHARQRFSRLLVRFSNSLMSYSSKDRNRLRVAPERSVGARRAAGRCRG